AQTRVKREVQLPEGYYLTWGGEFENQRRAMKRLMIIVPISISVIFMPLYLTHTVLSVSAAVGFITLFGVAVMDGVLLVTYIQQAHAQHGNDSKDAIMKAVSQRLRPVLMTALLASLGRVPAAMSHE